VLGAINIAAIIGILGIETSDELGIATAIAAFVAIIALIFINLIYLGVWANISGKLTLRTLRCPNCGKTFIEKVKTKRFFQRKDKITCECDTQIKLTRSLFGFSIKDWEVLEVSQSK